MSRKDRRERLAAKAEKRAKELRSRREKVREMTLPEFIAKKSKWIEKVFLVAVLLSVLCIPFVNVNYDLTEYLPDSVDSKAGLNLMEEKFGYPGTARVMIDDVTLYEAKQYKDRLEAVEGVDQILWCDTAVDVYASSEFIDYDAIEDYYKDGAAVMDVTFVEGDSSKLTSQAIDEMQAITGEKGHYVGMAVQSKSLAEKMAEEMKMILSMAVVFIFLILCIATTSWFEPVLFLLVMGVAILLNKGTNIFLGTISFLTDNVVAVLQLAVSMDYSIFLLHAYTRYKESGQEQVTALTNAIEEALNSILASSLTTIVGFVVLVVMKFNIGFDLGLSLAKGVVCSLFTVLFLMPAMILRMSDLIERFAHKSFLPDFEKLSRGICKIRLGVLAAVVILVIPMYTAQSMNSYQFGNASVGAGKGTAVYEDDQKIVEKFGRSNMMMAIVPSVSNVTEKELTEKLEDLPYMKSVQSLSGTLPEGVPEEFLPESVTGLLHKNGYSRILMYTRTKEESDMAFQCADEIREIIRQYYPEESYLVGGTPSTQDIKTVITKDYKLVNLLSILGVFLVVMFTYKSLAIPLVVMIPIEVAIYFNMAVPYLKGEQVVFMGYVIVSCIQLGATVDYSILTTSNYIEARKTMDKHKAAAFTLNRSFPAILTSGSILTVCGYVLYQVSTISAIGDLGHLVGRGAWISMLLVLTLLPALLVLVDPLLTKNELVRLREWHKKRVYRKKKALAAVKAAAEKRREKHGTFEEDVHDENQ
ncbi:MAG: MMPL family transporter [Lachnospiraceae bacterium]|nr:MMPL family transporter [Lachnospiraceae bacterium]